MKSMLAAAVVLATFISSPVLAQSHGPDVQHRNVTRPNKSRAVSSKTLRFRSP